MDIYYEIYYEQAIDILTKEQDWKNICIAVAKKDPKLFCEASGKLPWQMTAKEINETEGKGPAIKYVRAQTDMGLKEAKEAVESLPITCHQYRYT